MVNTKNSQGSPLKQGDIQQGSIDDYLLLLDGLKTVGTGETHELAIVDRSDDDSSNPGIPKFDLGDVSLSDEIGDAYSSEAEKDVLSEVENDGLSGEIDDASASEVENALERLQIADSIYTPHKDKLAKGANGAPESKGAKGTMAKLNVLFISTPQEPSSSAPEDDHWGPQLHKALATQMRSLHATEDTFELAFFGDFIAHYVDETSSNRLLDDDCYILRETGDYAIALMRQLTMHDLWFGKRLGPASATSRCDHAVVILKKKKSTRTWDIEACTKTIELKTRCAASVEHCLEGAAS